MSKMDDMGQSDERHLSDEEMLAFLDQRGHPDELWLMKQQHIIICSRCYGNMRSFEQIRTVIRDSHQSTENAFYPLITEKVVQRIGSEKAFRSWRFFDVWHPSYREQRERSYVYDFSFALVLLLLFVITITTIVTTRQGTPAHHNSKLPATPTAKVQVDQLSRLSPTPTVPTPTIVATKVSTAAPNAVMTLTDCTSDYDVIMHHMHICGSDFKPGDIVSLTLVDAHNNIIRQIGPIHVQGDGTFIQTVPIHGCKDVPSVIYARDKSFLTQELPKLTNINFGNC